MADPRTRAELDAAPPDSSSRSCYSEEDLAPLAQLNVGRLGDVYPSDPLNPDAGRVPSHRVSPDLSAWVRGQFARQWSARLDWEPPRRPTLVCDRCHRDRPFLLYPRSRWVFCPPCFKFLSHLDPTVRAEIQATKNAARRRRRRRVGPRLWRAAGGWDWLI